MITIQDLFWLIPSASVLALIFAGIFFYRMKAQELEIARLVNQRQPELGIDIIFLDAEDYGTHDQNNEESWCLGAQYRCV